MKKTAGRRVSKACAAVGSAAAVMIQAVKDAQAGDGDAAVWLDDAGDVALALELAVDAFAGWRGVEVPINSGRRRAARGRRESSAERSRRYRERKKAHQGL